MMCLNMEEVDEEYEKGVDEAISEAVHCLSDELKEILTKNRACWVGRRDRLGASSTIFRELAEEDPLEFKRILRMSVGQFNELLNLIEPKI
ncbi:hypothetical protein PPYR_04875 [Photinus pyralis]|uniref:Dynein heavy chain tail domain-containing protein n=1 Tax=Photinus pyralis TaxID=7054 RepID=A0A5N4AZC2_PHOPY|nr:hypothetical protein PPYR_04875 [Photinus pyralis]